jgi:MFS family permease
MRIRYDSLGRYRSKFPAQGRTEAINRANSLRPSDSLDPDQAGTGKRQRRAAIAHRASPLRGHNFRRFYIGQVTSLLGTSMSAVAVTFAVLGNGGSATDLGYVIAARILPQVVLVLGGGVLADRLGRRPVMLGSDVLRCAAQAVLAALLLAGRPATWLIAALAALVGTGEAFFGPALDGLAVEIVPRDELGRANALLGLARSASGIAGPVLAGLLVAAAGPAVVVAIDAASYGASVIALAGLRLSRAGRPPGRPLLRDMAEGWTEFRSRTWLWVTTVQFALFNLITWAPYLVLGPVLAHDYLGGARAWGLIMAATGAGAILGGLTALSHRPRRPLVTATVATLGYPMPCLLLALHAPAAWVASGAFAAGAGGALAMALGATVLQQQVPQDRLSRASSFSTFGAFGPGLLGLVIAGPAAAQAGPGRVLGVGAAWAALSSLVVLSLPAIRAVPGRDGTAPAVSEAGERGA